MAISVGFLSNNDRGNKRQSFVLGQKIIKQLHPHSSVSFQPDVYSD